jgi:hypothetical protein
MKSNRLLIASVVAIATTSFGFIVRANLITEWGNLYNLTETQKGALQGAQPPANEYETANIRNTCNPSGNPNSRADFIK